MPLKISASTVAFPGIPLLDLPKRADASAVEGLAITVAENGSLRPDATESEIATFLTRCGDFGISVSAIYGYAGRSMLGDPVARAADVELAKRCIDLAARMGAPVSRMFAGSGPPTDDLIDRFTDACRPVVEHAAQARVWIGLPTHHDLAFDANSCRRLVDGLGRKRAGIIFNGPSLEMDGIAPVRALRKMRDIVVQAELKDWERRGGAFEAQSIGLGQATVWPIVEALDELDFGGWVTLHHLKQHHPDLPELKRSVAEAVRLIAALRVIN